MEWCGGKGKVEMGWEKDRGMSERGCADVCGQCGRKGKGGNAWGEGLVGMSERGCADCRRKGKDGNGWGEGPVGMSERG